MKKNYILDTNVLLTDHNSIFSYGNNDVVTPNIDALAKNGLLFKNASLWNIF